MYPDIPLHARCRYTHVNRHGYTMYVYIPMYTYTRRSKHIYARNMDAIRILVNETSTQNKEASA